MSCVWHSVEIPNRTGSKQNQANKRSELITIMGRGGKTWLSREWKTVEFNSVSSLNNRRYTRSLKLCESNLETYHVKTHQSVWGCSLCTVTSPSVSNPSYHNPRVRRSPLVESHKAYCGNRQVEGVRVLGNNFLSFKLSLLSKENKSSINKPTYTYWVEVSPRSVKGCTLVFLKRRNLFSTVLYSDLLRRNLQNHIS